MNIFQESWVDYVEKLGKRVNKNLITLDDFILALKTTHDYFSEFHCVSSDHGVMIPLGYSVEKATVEQIYKKRLVNEETSEEEHMLFMSYMLHEFAKLNAEKGWIMQIHISYTGVPPQLQIFQNYFQSILD